jgi:hypothetical protein
VDASFSSRRFNQASMEVFGNSKEPDYYCKYGKLDDDNFIGFMNWILD